MDPNLIMKPPQQILKDDMGDMKSAFKNMYLYD